MQNLYEDLAKILEKDERVFADGKIIKNKVSELAFKLDKDLLNLLLKNKQMKDHFFVEAEGDILVFDQDKFIKFINNKEFLPDSFTTFKNHIGLTGNDEYIKDNGKVVLAWGYKDCILEGGQNKEDAERDEIFYNEILAPDEIDRLFEPKVLTKFKKFDASKEYDIETITGKDNLLIKGNNLLALRCLRDKYFGKIKLVYLDPPYNTPGEANTFSYNNSFNHSSWLTFMKNRIEVAKDLTSEDGFICLSIDDVEYAYLKVMCDEVLGRDNFLATVAVQVKKEGRTDSEFFATSHDYALFYCKNKGKAKLNTLSISEENARKWKESDKTGRFYWRDFVRTGGNSTPIDRYKQAYAIYYSKSKKEIVGVGGYSEKGSKEPYNSDVVYFIGEDGDFKKVSKKEFTKNNKDLTEFYPTGSKGEKQVWRWSDREKVLWAMKMGEISLVENKIKIKDRIRQGSKPTTTWYDSDFNATSHGTLLLKKLFDGKKMFSYPKSLFTMMDIIDITTNKDTNDIILDIFGGSATTAHAVNRVNKLDNGNRKFIIVEQMDYIERATLPRIQKSLGNKEDYFVYFELKEWNEEYMQKIQEAKTSKELADIYKEMQKEAFFRYEIDLSKFNEKDFSKLELRDQKQVLMECLDKNHLYVNYSEIDDSIYKVSAEDKKINKQFYGK